MVIGQHLDRFETESVPFQIFKGVNKNGKFYFNTDVNNDEETAVNKAIKDAYINEN